MVKRLLCIATVGLLLSGCFMGPLALVGPAISGFSTTSMIQSSVTTGANYLVKRNTGKTIGQHALDAVTKDVLLQAYFPSKRNSLIVAP